MTERTQPRTVIVGGMFDPPHNGHVAMVAAATIPGDDVHIVVSAVPPHRAPSIASMADRLAMAAAAFVDHPKLAGRSIKIDDIEHRMSPAVSYTVETVRHISSHQTQGRPVLVVGDEHAATIESWHSWKDLLGMVDLAVVTRHGAVMAGTHGAARLERLAEQCGAAVWWCPMSPVSTSSTGIRDAVEQGDDAAVAAGVPRGVASLLSGIYGMIPNAGG